MGWLIQKIGALVVGTVVLAGTAAMAQEPDPPPPALPPSALVHLAPGASTYPANALLTLEMIEQGYVRTVAKADLLVAALSGLYEIAGESVPNTLRADVEKAIKAKQELRLVERTRKRPEIARRVKDDEALLASCRAMLRTLDPYCEVLTGDEARRSTGRMDNFGTGIDLDEEGLGPARIKVVLAGSPAQRTGLRPGDRITAINGRSLELMSRPEATMRLNGAEIEPLMVGDLGGKLTDSLINAQSTVRIRVEREGKSHEITLKPERFHAETVYGVRRHDDNTWDYWIDRDRKIAHVRIGPLRNETADDLRDVLATLQSSGLRGLLLDLRWCPGGLLNESVKAAGLFLDKCRIFSGKGRDLEPLAEMDNLEPGPFRDVPILVLVNGESSGGAELIAAALQDHKRANIAGQRTRGKASIQTMRALPVHGAHLKLTSAIFLCPSGKNLNRFPDSKPGDDWGVRPNERLEFRISKEMNQQLRDWWAAQTLRPGGARERLPLDDPNADPQRQLALQVLRARIVSPPRQQGMPR